MAYVIQERIEQGNVGRDSALAEARSFCNWGFKAVQILLCL